MQFRLFIKEHIWEKIAFRSKVLRTKINKMKKKEEKAKNVKGEIDLDYLIWKNVFLNAFILGEINFKAENVKYLNKKKTFVYESKLLHAFREISHNKTRNIICHYYKKWQSVK